MKRRMDSYAARLASVSRMYRKGDREVRALKDVTLDIERGEIVAVTGASGSGKSALLRMLSCLECPDEGRELILGKGILGLETFELAELRNRKIGYIPQECDLIADLTVLDNVAVPLRMLNISESRLRHRAWVVLDGFGLGKRAGDRAGRLSSSERALAMLARALVIEPDLIVADDPTGPANDPAGARIIDTLNDARAELNATVVAATADPRLLNIADRAVELHNGVIERVIPRRECRIRPPSIQ